MCGLLPGTLHCNILLRSCDLTLVICSFVRIHLAATDRRGHRSCGAAVGTTSQASLARKLQMHAYMDCLQDDLLAQIFRQLSLHERCV